MEPPTYSHSEFISSEYRWRHSQGKILAIIFSQQFPLGKNKKLQKVMEKNQIGENVDVDAKTLRKLLEDRKMLPVQADVVDKINLSFRQVENYLQELDNQDSEVYDCFFFAFLTYAPLKNYGSYLQDDRLHFNDETIEEGVVPFEKILNIAKNLTVARGKPKIFLVQADDLSLLKERQISKGPTSVRDEGNRKIPQDADRLIIKSTIPQLIANLVEPETECLKRKNEKKPSFLIQAFVKAVHENAKKAQGERMDLLSLTTHVNGIVAQMVAESNHFRSGDMFVPLTTSTFTKLLNLHPARKE